MKIVENSMAEIIINNKYFVALQKDGVSKFDRYMHAYEVMKAEKTVMQTYPTIAACAWKVK